MENKNKLSEGTLMLNMKLHEQLEVCNGAYLITRVIGGWIYCRQEPSVNIANPVFVPFSTMI